MPNILRKICSFVFASAVYLNSCPGNAQDASHEPALRNSSGQCPSPKRTTTLSKEVTDALHADAQAELSIAAKLLKEEQYLVAISHLNRAIRLDPHSETAYILRGNAYCRVANYREAINSYSDHIKLKPDDPAGYVLRARAYGWNGWPLRQKQDEAKIRSLQTKLTNKH